MKGRIKVQMRGVKEVKSSLSGASATTTQSDYKRLWKNEAMPSPIRVQPSKIAPWLAPACSEARRERPRVPRNASETRRAALQRTGHCADATKNRAPTKLTVVQVVLRKFKELRDKWAQGAVPRAGSARDGRLQTCGRKGRSHGVRRPPNLTPRALEHQMH